MKLKRLVLQGFKSFKDRTNINFDSGITGIVGPNGCGKSNVVDALFWVMGEQSAKHLRGNAMKDVIFSGSSKYGPAAWAEVTLVLENTEGKHIHIGPKVAAPSEIQLTRKLYRNGETEYRINDTPCRLKDIQEVFMDTGAGAKSYSIIAQGEINRLVQAKPEERRAMIEEVAGVTKFKMRKRDSLRKIEQAQLNLNRLTDLKLEIDKNLKILEKQAEKAQRARNLKEKVKKYELVVESHKVFDLLQDYRQGRTSLNEKKLQVEQWSLAKTQTEVSLEEERIRREDQQGQIESMQAEYNKVSKALAAAEERLNYLCKSLTEKEKLIETREKEKKEIEQDLVNRQTRLETLRVDSEDLKNKKEEGFDFSDLEEKVLNLKEELELKESSHHELLRESKEIKENFGKLEQQIFRNNSRMEEYNSNLHDIDQEIEVLEKQFSKSNADTQEDREEVRTLEKQVEELSTEEKAKSEKVHQLKTEVAQLQNELQQTTKEYIKTESKLASLKELQQSLEGLKEGSKDILQSNEHLSTVSSLIQCEDRYILAVQNALSLVMDAIVSEKDSISLSTEQKEKGVDLLLIDQIETDLSTESFERIKLYAGETVIPLFNVVKIPEKHEAFFKTLMSGHYLVENNANISWEEIPTNIQFKTITTIDGRTIVRNLGHGKVLTYSSADRQGGAIERNNRIAELEGKVHELQLKQKELENSFQAKEKDFSQTQDEFSKIHSLYLKTKEDFITKKSGLEGRLAIANSNNSRLDILKNRKNEISKQRLAILENEEELQNNFENFKDRSESIESQIENSEDILQTLKSTYQQEKDLLTTKQIESKSFADRVKTIEGQIDDVQSQIERLGQKLIQNESLINQYRSEIDQTQEELSTLEQSNKDVANMLLEQEEKLSDHKDQFAQLLLGMQSREEEVKELGRKISKTDKELVELEVKLGQWLSEEEQIVKNSFEKYRIDLRQVIGKTLNYVEEEYAWLMDVSSMYHQETADGIIDILPEQYEFTRRYGQDLRDAQMKFRDYKTEFSRLGEINWQAIEDYDRQKLRFDFLATQELELKKSLMDLQTAIAHIDEKSKIRFKIAFEEVNVRFQKVFPIIFGGGSAELKVVGNLDEPECGVDIIAQPPGKKMQNINLMSGGEKAMTAVSLIFSIFLVKPSPFCLLDEVDAPLDDANVGRFNELLREMSSDSQFILITHNKKTMELNDMLYGITMQEPGISKAVSVQLH